MVKISDLDKHVHGSIWRWDGHQDSERSANRAQNGDEFVLIISNDKFNSKSKKVNCASISSALKKSPVHVLVTLKVESEIRCEELHTVPKTQLFDYFGMADSQTLSAVKKKIRHQLRIRENDADMLQQIIKILGETNESIVNSFQNVEKDLNLVQLLYELLSDIKSLKTDLSLSQQKVLPQTAKQSCKVQKKLVITCNQASLKPLIYNRIKKSSGVRKKISVKSAEI